MYHRPLGYRANVYSRTAAPPPAAAVNLINIELPQSLQLTQPAFLYLWAPGGP